MPSESTPLIDWIYQFLRELGILPPAGRVVEATRWAITAFDEDPSLDPEIAAQTFVLEHVHPRLSP